jgi:hypothetical protein
MSGVGLRISWLAAAALLVVAAVALTLGMPRSARAQGDIGLITHLTDARSVALLRAANVRHAKTTLYWDRWETDSAYRRDFAAGIARLAGAQLELTVVVHAPPAAIARYADRRLAYARFADFVGARAAQFPAVRYWQLWNEVDAPGWTELFGAGRVSMREQGRLYGQMLTLASPRIRQASPKARVVISGLAGPEDSIGVFLQGIYDARGPFDVVAVHAYGPPVWKAARDRAAVLRAVMRARGDERPLWLTEFGISDAVMRQLWRIGSRDARDRRQADEWRELAEWNDRAGGFDRMVGYALIDEAQIGYGIVDADGVRVRPAYRWLQSRNAAAR